MREDFEIYEFTRNGQQWFGFKVDYWGRYAAPTREKILAIRRKVRQQVKKKLEWIEEENKRYYARLAEEERQRALLFKQTKEFEKEIQQILNSKISPSLMTSLQKKVRLKRIKYLIKNNYSNTEIRDITGASFSAISSIRYNTNKRKGPNRRRESIENGSLGPNKGEKQTI